MIANQQLLSQKKLSQWTLIHNSHKELNKTAKFEVKSEKPVKCHPVQPKAEGNKTEKVEPTSLKTVEDNSVKTKTEGNKTVKVEPKSVKPVEVNLVQPNTGGNETLLVEPASVNLFLELNPVKPHKEANKTSSGNKT